MSGAAIHAFRAALDVRTRAADPRAWARTKRQLGQALIMLGERGSDRKILSEAIAAFNEALQEILRDTSPMEWARSKLGLGTALASSGNAKRGPCG